MRKLPALAVLMLLCSMSLHAEPADLLKPYVDDQTALIVRVDFSKVEMGTLKTWMLDAMRQAQAGAFDEKATERAINEAILPVSAWMIGFTKSGGRFVYLLGDTTFQEPIILMPLEKDANAVALQGALPVQGGYQTTIRENMIVCARPNRLQQLARTTQRPEIAAALASAGDAMLVVAVVPSAEVRKVVAELMPTLPREVGGGATAPLVNPCVYTVLTVDLKPKVALRIFMETTDAGSAATASAAMSAALASLITQPELEKWPAATAALALIKPAANGKRVEIPLEAAGPKLAVLAVDGAMMARGNASMQVAASNARQILMGCHMYANDKKGVFPPALEEIVKAGYVPKEMLNIPQRPGVAWVYLPPPPLNKLGASNEQLVLHDPADPWPEQGVIAGFADGHVEFIKDRARFEETLKKSQERNKQAEK